MQTGQGVWLLRESVDTDWTVCMVTEGVCRYRLDRVMVFFTEGICRYRLDRVHGEGRSH